MISRFSDLKGYVLQGIDGKVGQLVDLYFDDQTWQVRYLVVNTGNWLSGRRVLVNPGSMEAPQFGYDRIPVSLTQAEVKDSPPIDLDKPVSRQQEIDLFKHYNWLPYWGAPRMHASPKPPMMLATATEAKVTETTKIANNSSNGQSDVPTATITKTDEDVAVQVEDREDFDPNLRSVSEVTGYRICAPDDEIGHVEDFIIDMETWAIRYVIVDTRNWLPGKKVLLALDWINYIDWAERCLNVDLNSTQIANSPEYDIHLPISKAYVNALHEHYGRILAT
ncbi:MAG TPA: PRC-barrel domain-containing protein [Anaerolineae bacterium]|nr:PRC-barrel domain-containing protein [Anaerolineae bacterium]